MKYTPQGNDGSASAVILLCYVAAALSLLVPALGLQGAVFFQLGAVILLTVGTFFLIRYKLTEYVYVLHADTDDISFSVRRVQGKTEVIIANFSVNDVKAFKPVAQNNWKNDPDITAYGKAQVRLYNYCKNLHPENPYAFIFDNRDGTYSALIIEPGADMIKYAENLLANKPEDGGL